MLSRIAIAIVKESIVSYNKLRRTNNEKNDDYFSNGDDDGGMHNRRI